MGGGAEGIAREGLWRVVSLGKVPGRGREEEMEGEMEKMEREMEV